MIDSKIVVALDIGATRVSSAIGRVDERKRINVIGMGCSPPLGLENGIVVDMELLTGSVERAMIEAEEISGVNVESVFVGMAQTNFRGISSRGVVSIPGASREINRRDVNRVIEVARVVASRSNLEPVQEVVQQFMVDGQSGIKNPTGMYGFKLEAEVYIVTGNFSTFSRTIAECIKKAGFEVEGMILEPLAAGEAVLTQSEKKLGVLLIDLGGESTTAAVFVNGNVIGARVLAVGANQITVDIAGKFHVPMSAAERLKREHGCAMTSLAKEESIAVAAEEGVVGNRIPSQNLAEVIQHRVESIFSLVRREVEGTRFPRGVGESVVLTGGGALLEGITELAHQKFALPVRMGKPDGRVEGWGKLVNSPAYSTVMGLLPGGLNKRGLTEISGMGWQGPITKVKNWIKEFF